MDTARCLCKLPQGPHNTWTGRETTEPSRCPIHGPAPPDSCLPYLLNYQDKAFLRRIRVDPEDSADIADVYRSDLKERR